MKFLVSPTIMEDPVGGRLTKFFAPNEHSKGGGASSSKCGRFCNKCGKDCPEECGSKCFIK